MINMQFRVLIHIIPYLCDDKQERKGCNTIHADEVCNYYLFPKGNKNRNDVTLVVGYSNRI